jgi:DNA-directed RNA polymerase specialized sigma24 family protein
LTAVSSYLDEMEDVQDLATRVASEDPSEGLRAVAALRRLLERVERIHVESARARGVTWQEIADELGVSKQAVHQRYASKRRRW